MTEAEKNTTPQFIYEDCNFEFCGKLRAGVPPVEQTFQDEF